MAARPNRCRAAAAAAIGILCALPASPARAGPDNWLLGTWSRSPGMCATLNVTFAPGQIVETVVFGGQVRRAVVRNVVYRVEGPSTVTILLPEGEREGPGPRFEAATREDPETAPGRAVLERGDYGMPVFRCPD